MTKPTWVKMELLRLITPALGAIALTMLTFMWNDIREVRTSVAELQRTTAKDTADLRERVARVEARVAP